MPVQCIEGRLRFMRGNKKTVRSVPRCEPRSRRRVSAGSYNNEREWTVQHYESRRFCRIFSRPSLGTVEADAGLWRQLFIRVGCSIVAMQRSHRLLMRYRRQAFFAACAPDRRVYARGVQDGTRVNAAIHTR
jgi:hypothetical protein